MGSVGSVTQFNTLEDKYKHINPNFKQGVSNLDKEGYNNNCVQCALAFEANMRGEDVEANPFTFGNVDTLHKAQKVEDAFTQEHVWDIGRNTRQSVITQIEMFMKDDWGNGSRAIIQERSKGRRHTMNVINNNGNIVIVDAQNGTHGSPEKMLKGLNTKSIVLFRTDNKKMNKDYTEWAYRKRR